MEHANERGIVPINNNNKKNMRGKKRSESQPSAPKDSKKKEERCLCRAPGDAALKHVELQERTRTFNSGLCTERSEDVHLPEPCPHKYPSSPFKTSDRRRPTMPNETQEPRFTDVRHVLKRNSCLMIITPP